MLIIENQEHFDKVREFARSVRLTTSSGVNIGAMPPPP